MKVAMSSGAALIAIIGDVHGEIPLALHVLDQLEQQAGKPIVQIFCVGDFGLFLAPEDWTYLIGPKKHRFPANTARIVAAWKEWRWPLAMVGGNHEPLHRLRAYDSDWFGPQLTYTDGGELVHRIPGLRVYGLSGIHHPEALEFPTHDYRGHRLPTRPQTWTDMVALVAAGLLSPKQLSYFKRSDLERLKALPPEPHLLLTHDWPFAPAHLPPETTRRPERELLDVLRPQMHFCGHHHIPQRFTLGPSVIRALEIIRTSTTPPYKANPSWCQLLFWKDGTLSDATVSAGL
jgi:lariat debranching enzyme